MVGVVLVRRDLGAAPGAGRCTDAGDCQALRRLHSHHVVPPAPRSYANHVLQRCEQVRWVTHATADAHQLQVAADVCGTPVASSRGSAGARVSRVSWRSD